MFQARNKKLTYLGMQQKYYRAMIKRGSTSWKVHDEHMVSTINRLIKFHGKDSKIIVWEHKAYIGDERARYGIRGYGNCRTIVKRKIRSRRCCYCMI